MIAFVHSFHAKKLRKLRAKTTAIEAPNEDEAVLQYSGVESNNPLDLLGTDWIESIGINSAVFIAHIPPNSFLQSPSSHKQQETEQKREVKTVVVIFPYRATAAQLSSSTLTLLTCIVFSSNVTSLWTMSRCGNPERCLPRQIPLLPSKNSDPVREISFKDVYRTKMPGLFTGVLKKKYACHVCSFD